MSLIAKASSGDFAVPEEGLQQAVCCDVIDLGMKETPWGQKHKCSLVWQVEEINPETQKRFQVVQQFNVTLSEGSKLRALLEGWRNRRFTDEELDGFDLEVLIGKNCQLQIIHHKTEKGGIFANVQNIVPIGKKTSRMEVEGYTRESLQATEMEEVRVDSEESDDEPEF